MLECPKSLHKLYKFKCNEKLYVSDLDECKVLEIDELTWRILDLCTDHTTEQIFERLSEIYEEDEIAQCLKALENLEKIGLFFGGSSIRSQPDSKPMKILALTGSTYGFADLTWMAIGAQVAHFHILEALTKFSDVYMTREDGAPEGVHLTSLNPNDSASLLKLALSNYERSILTLYSDGMQGCEIMMLLWFLLLRCEIFIPSWVFPLLFFTLSLMELT